MSRFSLNRNRIPDELRSQFCLDRVHFRVTVKILHCLYEKCPSIRINAFFEIHIMGNQIDSDSKLLFIWEPELLPALSPS